MSVISSVSSVASAVVNAIKSIDNHTHNPEQKDVEEETYTYPSIDKANSEDNDEDSDSNYDPKDDEEQGIKDEAEDFEESDASDASEASASVENSDVNEETLVNSEEFEKELNAAIENVLKVAQLDRETILANACREFSEASDQLITDSFKVFHIEDVNREDIEDEVCEIDAEVFRKEFEEALRIVHDVAKWDQEELVHTISDISYDFFDSEPAPQQITEIFGRIKQQFAEEAREEFLDENEFDETDETDSDYDEEEDIVLQHYDEENDDSEDSDYSPTSDEDNNSQDEKEDEFASDEDNSEQEEEEEIVNID